MEHHTLSDLHESTSYLRDAEAAPATIRGDVAIIGMSCLFPGAPDLDAYWQNILGKRDAVTDPPPELIDLALAYDADAQGSETDRIYCQRGGYIGPLAYFDPLAYKIPPIAVGGEPDQWLALKLACDALEDAGYPEPDEQVRRRTGVILGKGTYLNAGNLTMAQHGLVINQTLEILKSLHPGLTDEEVETFRETLKSSLPPISSERVAGLIPNIIVGRIANHLDLQGSTYTVDAACASSLIAVQSAMRELLTDECDLVLVGGSQVSTMMPILNAFCQMGALSRRQQIRPFDKDADGTILGEGIGMVVLKRLADAERDGDRIYAVIKGVGIASDGRGVSVMAPRLEGEIIALQRAYEAAGVSPDSIGLIEAHGTATPVGDVVEMQALKQVFGPRRGPLPSCAIGSVKSMISHTMPAAGIAGVIKTALALYHNVLPPTLNCDEPNPKLELESSPFYINTETRPWIHRNATPRRAGVNSFGFGGINGHVVMEEYTAGVASRDLPNHLPARENEVFILKGSSASELVSRASELAQFVEAHIVEESLNGPVPPSLGGHRITLTDIAFTLNQQLEEGGAGGQLRLALVAGSLTDLRDKLLRAIERLEDPKCRQIRDRSGIYYSNEPLSRQGNVAFLFPGEGSQYPNMLADLCLHFPEVRACFDQMDQIFTNHPRGYAPGDYIFPRPAFSAEEAAWAEERIWEMDGALESVLTANHAIATLLRKLHIRPDFVVGHSTGEYSAMRAAGILELDSDQQLAQFANVLNQNFESAKARAGVPQAGLLAVGADRSRVEAIASEIGDGVFVAMDNCPHQAVLVGDLPVVERAQALVNEAGLVSEFLAFDRPYHTELFGPYAEHLHQVFAGFAVQPPQIPIYSCTTAAPYPSDPSELRELIVDHWVKPVEFRQTIETLYHEGVRIFIEAGPRSNLTSFVEDILRGRSFHAVPANIQRRSGIEQINHLLANLAVHGVGMNLDYLYRRHNPKHVDFAFLLPADGERRSPSMIKLATEFPFMHLSGPAVETFNGEQRTVADIEPVSSELVQPAFPAPEIEPVARQENGNLRETPVPPGAAGAAADTPVVQGFLHSMEQFLTVQDEIMQQYFGQADITPDGLLDGIEAGPGSYPDVSDHRAAFPAQAVPTRNKSRYPLLGETIRQSADEIVFERTFDPEEDRYLRDHTLGRDVSTSDPDLLAFAVMPLTMSLEILAEAGAALVPDQHVIGLRDVYASRWIAFEGEAQRLQVVARRSPGTPDRITVQLRNLTEDAAGDSANMSPVLRAEVLFGEHYPSSISITPLQLSDPKPSRWNDDDLYRDVMFHGPCWQGVEHIEAKSDSGVRARLRVLPFARFFRDQPDPDFVLDPVVLDAAGQVIGFWTMEQLETDRLIFPFRLDALDIFSPGRPAGESLTCTASIDLIGQKQVRSDIDILDSRGQLWMRLTGWEDKRFTPPGNLYPIILAPRETSGSLEYQQFVADFPEPTTFSCRGTSTVIPADSNLWKRVWAGCVLSRTERDDYARLRIPEPRRLAWLAGRTAAKDAVRSLLQTYYARELAPADIEVRPDERGRPIVQGSWTGSITDRPVVSITHTGDAAFAIAGLPRLNPGFLIADELRIGIDAEQIRERPAGFDELAFTESERGLLLTTPAATRDEWILRCWCAKEAVGKALGYGLVEGPGSVVVTTIDALSGQVRIRLRGQLEMAFPELANSSLLVHTYRQMDMVIATTMCEREHHRYDDV